MVDLSSRKTVIFIVPILHYGGAERVLHEIVENLSPEYFECHIISFESTTTCPFKFNRQTKIHFLHPDKPFPHKGIPAARKIGFIKKIFRLKKMLNSFPHNAILVPFLARPTAAYTVLAQLGSKRRIFASLHTTESEYMKFNYRSAIRRKLEIILLKLACRGSDKIIAASKGVKKDLVDNFSVPSSKIQVVDNPIDLVKIHRMTSQPPAIMLADYSTKSIFLHIGRLSAEKNHQLLIKAAATLRNSALDFVILIAGSGDQESKIKNWIQEEQLQDNVTMLGNIENPYALMARSRALVLTSHYESSPMVLKEAMASGTAVIAVDCPHGPADILKKGTYGLLIPPDDPKALADAMLTLARNDRLHDNLVQKGLSRAGQYDIGNIIHQWQDLFMQAG